MATSAIVLQQARGWSRLQPYILQGLSPTGRQLGRGSFGSVIELQMHGGALCAGKKLHDALFDPQNQDVQKVVEKFVSECELMSKIRHPNIVNFYGLALIESCSFPVLVMELMDRSLEDYLERLQPKDIHFAIRVSILFDITKGLAFLHNFEPPIVHCDLTARNILLTATYEARIADLGNSQIINVEKLMKTLSTIPGNLNYMSPEALEYKPRYDVSLDIFSFGHTALYVLSQTSPCHLLQATYPNSSGKLQARSEVERRTTYFEKIEGNELIPFKLVETVKACLDNIPHHRPTATQMSEVLEQICDESEEYLFFKRVGRLSVAEECDSQSPPPTAERGPRASHGRLRIAGDSPPYMLEMNVPHGGLRSKNPFSTDSAGPGELQHKYLQKLDELIQKKKLTYLQYLKMYFIGCAGLGKTTTRKRLTGAIVNLSKLSPQERKRCSTYLAECTQVLAVVDDSNDSKLILQASENLDEEARLLFNYLYGSKAGEEDVDGDTTATISEKEGNTSSTAHHKSDVAKKSGPTQQTKQGEDAPQEKQDEDAEQLKRDEDTQQATQDIEKNEQKPAGTHVKVDVDQVVTRLRSIVGSGKYAEELLGKILLNLVDVGGQPGFLEMLPFLSKGPGIFLAFFPLDKDLDEQLEVSYERGDHKITPYKATYTTREALSQILSSVSHHASFNSNVKKEHAEKLSSFCNVKPTATLVGTFKDRLEMQVKAELLHKQLSNEFPSVTQVDMEEAVRCTLGDEQVPKEPSGNKAGLQSAVEHHLSTEPFKQEVKDRLEEVLEEKNEALESTALNFAELLSFPTADRCFIAVDNYTGTDSDIDPLRKHLQEVFASHFKDAKVPIQPSQLLLGVVLRKEYDIVSMEDCIQIGRALNMGEEDVRFTVWFLDFLVGALIYHPDIDDAWFKENIICSPQVVFDSISNLITEALLEFHSKTKTSKLKLDERKDWLEKGQFSIDTVRRCHSKGSKKKVQEGKLIPVEKLIMLLEHSNLLAQITVKVKVGREERLKTMCFIPAILECATTEELTKSPPPDADTPSPVKITFEPRYVPIGVFCATISRLVSRGKDGILGIKWELADSCVKRNLVTFRVDSSKHIVTLVAHVECIEVRLIRQKRRITLHDLSAYVLSAIIYVIKEIDSLVDPIIAFDCPCGQHQSKGVDKLCCLLPGVSPCFECEHGEVDTLSPHQQCWFAKEVKPQSEVCLKALKYAKKADLQSLSFEWSKDGSEKGTANELKLEKVTDDDCEGYFACEIYKNGEPFFNVYHCLNVAGEMEISANDKLLGEMREALWEVRSDWYSLAVELGIDHGTRKAIEKDYHLQGIEVRFHAMLQKWIGTITAPTAQATLVRALKSPTIGRNDIIATANLEHVAVDAPMCEGSLSDTLNVDKHLRMVRAATWDARAKWKHLAVQLEIPMGDMEEIENNYRDQAGPCYTALLENWLTRSSPVPTWVTLIEALRSEPVERAALADEIELALKNN